MDQSDRDLVIYELEDKNVRNTDLYMYDLNTYYKFNDNTDNIIDKVLEYKNETLKMKHNSKISFTPEQLRIYKTIQNDGKYAISATTSFGKTTLIKEYIMEYNPKIVVYVVPTNSLADELLESFSKLYSDYSIIDTSVDEEYSENKKIIFVGTQEKLMDIKWLINKKIDLYVIDEAYKLSDEINGYREISLNRIFVDYINISKKFILLLPLVNSIDGLEKFGIKLLQSEYSPVAKKNIPIDEEKFDNFIISKINANDEKSLIYFDSPSDLENFYWNNMELIKLNANYDDKWIDRVEKDFHPDWLPIIAYKKGICIHHGSVPKFIQVRMVNKFNEINKYNTILSTSSLIEGINTPTKNIFIKDYKIMSEKNIIKFKNLIGRAGRLNVTPVGYIYYSGKYDKQFKIANENWKHINLKLVLSEDVNIEEINRDESSMILIDLSKKYGLNIEELKLYVEESGVNISQLEKYIIKIKKYQQFFYYHSWALDNVPGLVYFYIKCFIGKNNLFNLNVIVKTKEELSLVLNQQVDDNYVKKIKYDYFEKLFSATINSVIGENSMMTIKNMVDYILNNIERDFYKMNNSMIVSSVIKMIYNFLPYDLIPLIENTININEVFKNSGAELLSEVIINKLTRFLKIYNIKYYGSFDCDDKQKKIIKRFFEYGIPYNIIKSDLQFFNSNLKSSFSIIDIKKLIYQNLKLKEKYEKYFD